MLSGAVIEYYLHEIGYDYFTIPKLTLGELDRYAKGVEEVHRRNRRKQKEMELKTKRSRWNN